MPIVLDHPPAQSALTPETTIAEALSWAQAQLPPTRVIVKVEVDGQPLDTPDCNHDRDDPLADRTLSVSTRSKKDLALTTIGKLAALIEWLAPQHKDTARLLEQGNSTTALNRLGELLSAWHQIQAAYGNLARLLGVTMKDLPVRSDAGDSGMSGEMVLNEFCNHLAEMHSALQKRDLVLLADILQYEMDGAVANWMALLESTLALVEPAPATA